MKPKTPKSAQQAPSDDKRLGLAQTLDALQLPDALLKIQTVTQATGLSASTLYRLIAAGKLAEPIRMGKRCTRFRAADVRAFIQAQGVAS
ncbi:helix-turn-helix transcriptional regulator [Roseateles albus]|uniref:AlpA family phage regulatory protein n=1 Tax=Roseateles albus TaxID=2987525 RepID=A0ABT5KEG8_9BURK|nr:helix-turn-helix domain-containing protein [Roseateles albus]MDC8772331.1 AlpA family phage regulatory protein [Roseateles albus]